MLHFKITGEHKMAKKNNKTVETPQVETPQVTTPPVAPTEPPQISIPDLQLLARVVDLASRRGAFQANELSQVGDVYNKLSSFLTFIEDSKKAEDEASKQAAA
jgi:hypothetical protein